MPEATPSSASSFGDAEGSHSGSDEGVSPSPVEFPTGASPAEWPVPIAVPPRLRGMHSIIRRLRIQDLQLQFSHPSPDSPPSDGDTSIAGALVALDAESSTLLPAWIKHQDVQILLDPDKVTTAAGVVEYTVRSSSFMPTRHTRPSASSMHPSPPPLALTDTGGAALAADTGVLAADTDEPAPDSLCGGTNQLPDKFNLAGDLAATLSGDGLQAMMIHAEIRASLPKLAGAINRRDLVRFHLSDEVATHCSSRVLNRVFKRPRTRVRGKLSVRSSPEGTASGSGSGSGSGAAALCTRPASPEASSEPSSCVVASAATGI